MPSNLHRRAVSSNGVRKKETLIFAMLQYHLEVKQKGKFVPMHLPWVSRRSKAWRLGAARTPLHRRLGVWDDTTWAMMSWRSPLMTARMPWTWSTWRT